MISPCWKLCTGMTDPKPQTYYFVLASQKFLCEIEPLAETLREREKNYQERGKAKDFWLVLNPAFVYASSMTDYRCKCPQPSAAVISTDRDFITWLKLRLEFVLTGEFTAPSLEIPDPLATALPTLDRETN